MVNIAVFVSGGGTNLQALIDAESASKIKNGKITLVVSSKEEVREVLSQAVQNGGTLIKPAQDVFWGGYSGYFADPDSHLWEVAWNPHFWPGPKDDNKA